jgi:hypothetical protein
MKCSLRARLCADAARKCCCDVSAMKSLSIASKQFLFLSVAGRKTFWFEKIFSLRSCFPNAFSGGLHPPRVV